MPTYLGITCKKAPPTKRHRPAIWECMLGTVYAMNDYGIVRYFDYNHEAAILYAGINEKRNPRLARFTQNVSCHNGRLGGPNKKQLVLWIHC